MILRSKVDKWIEYATQIRGRPQNLLDAFDMHRHHGWDIILTMPQIADLHPRVRGLLEDAFAHKNLGRFGLAGRYVQKVHDGRANATNPSDVKTRKIDDRVFQLYQSTATGQFSDVKKTSGLIPWPVYVLGPIVLGLALYAIFYGNFSILGMMVTGDLSKITKTEEKKRTKKMTKLILMWVAIAEVALVGLEKVTRYRRLLRLFNRRVVLRHPLS